MNNSVIDVAFIAAKVAAIKDEKARMIVGDTSDEKINPFILFFSRLAQPLHQSKINSCSSDITARKRPQGLFLAVMLF